MIAVVPWLAGVYLAIGLLWAAFVAFVSIGLRLPFTWWDFADYVLCWPRDAWFNFRPGPMSAWLLVLLCMAIAGVGRTAFAQEGRYGQGHAENHDWYRDLKQPGTGFSCCNGSTPGIEGDCRPTRAYRGDDDQWYALLDGRWTPVPPRVVLKQLAPDGASHICASKSGLIYCFLGGSPKI